MSLRSAKSRWLLLCVFLSFSICLVTLVVINLVIHGIFFPNFWPSVILVLAMGTSCAAILKYAFASIPRKRWIASISILLTIGATALSPSLLVTNFQNLLGQANFFFVKNTYLRQISLLEKSDAPRMTSFGWERPMAKSLLIFDESDELHDPHRPKSSRWWKRAVQLESELASCLWWDQKVAQHFYIVTTYCQQPYSGNAIPKF